MYLMTIFGIISGVAGLWIMRDACRELRNDLDSDCPCARAYRNRNSQ